MESIPTFTTEFAHLLWQLTRDARAVETQKATLRRVMLAREPEGVEIELGALNIAIVASRGAKGVSEEVSWLSELTTRMAAHAVRGMYFAAPVPALEVLGVARALAAQPQLRDDGQAFDARIVALKLTAVTLSIGREGFVRHATPHAGVDLIPAITPSRALRYVSPRAGTRSLAERLKTPAAPPPAINFRGDVRTAEGADLPKPATLGTTGMKDESLAIVTREISRAEPIHDLSALNKLLAEAHDGDSATAAAAAALRAAEQRIQDGDWLATLGIVAALVKRDDPADNADVRRAYMLIARRLLSPHALRGLASLLPIKRDLRDQLHEVFVRSGESGVDTLIELMTVANTPGERRAYRDALAACPHAAPMLGHMLGDPQWFVVRNAAELLGEMGVHEVDGKLVETLNHTDARVRRAATGALARLGTPRALHALQDMLRDANPDIRRQAALGLGAAGQRAAANDLIGALEREQDSDVQQALITALGKMGTSDSVERLVTMARPGGLFKRKPTAVRIAAVNALGEAATPEALDALREMAGDRDKDVRSAIERAVREKSAL